MVVSTTTKDERLIDMGDVIYWDQVPAMKQARHPGISNDAIAGDCALAISTGSPVRMAISVATKNYKSKRRISIQAAEHGCGVAFDHTDVDGRDHVYLIPPTQ